MNWRILLIVIGVLALLGAGAAWFMLNVAELDPHARTFNEQCATCHGKDLQGTNQGPALLDRTLDHGDTVDQMVASIGTLHVSMPGFPEVMSAAQQKILAIYVGERRMGVRFAVLKMDREVELTDDVHVSEMQNFRLEKIIDGLDPAVFSIAPMPNGDILLTEKVRGISIISVHGEQSDPIRGTPETGVAVIVNGIHHGNGWLLDIALHPDCANNGWVYLHYTDFCGDRCDDDRREATLNRLDRGRIVDGQWVDVETIWQSPPEFYINSPDGAAGGRIAFDDSGHVYVSMGVKPKLMDFFDDTSAQDMRLPYGKIHRVRDDGVIPEDNPFADDPDYPVRTIWTYGHRSPQWLEWNRARGLVWNAEMGPRGGDELNELLPGRNYGWPYFSDGMEYAGQFVERHKLKGLEFDHTESEKTLVDFTPSPAISSFAFYHGKPFSAWSGNVLMGSLKGSSLYRLVFDGRTLTHRETVIHDLARIRDVEVGFDGLVYLLLETETGSLIVRLVPV